MKRQEYGILENEAGNPCALGRTISYVAGALERFVKKREYVLICFPKYDHKSLGAIFEQAALQLDAIPIFWEQDHRWKTLLLQAFVTRATTIVGPPLVVLGLSKIARATRTPLNIRNAVTAGYPCLDWMIEGITSGLDCRIWGCFGLGTGAVVSGFSCGCSCGVHIREDVYDFRILDEGGRPVPDGTVGVITLAHRASPDIRLSMRDHGRLDRTPCLCGQSSPRVMDIVPADRFPEDMLALYQQLHSWTSILDCSLKKGEYGLEIELVVFPGEKLPKLPSCARLALRPWDPDRDVPMDLMM